MRKPSHALQEYLEEIRQEVFGDGYKRIENYREYQVYTIMFKEPVIMDPVVVFVNADGDFWSPDGEEYLQYRRDVCHD